MTRRLGNLVLALVPVPLVLATDVAQRAWAGHPERFPSVAAYRLVLDGLSLLRYAAIFGAVILVWGWLRRRDAGSSSRLLAILAGPLTYSGLAFSQAADVFPLGEAAYYAVNPVWLAAVGCQIAMAGLGELLWRVVRRRGRRRPGLLPLMAMVVGWSVVYGTVLWGGGVHWFYVYQQGYRALFQ